MNPMAPIINNDRFNWLADFSKQRKSLLLTLKTFGQVVPSQDLS
jgi:hypothetical protein